MMNIFGQFTTSSITDSVYNIIPQSPSHVKVLQFALSLQKNHWNGEKTISEFSTWYSIPLLSCGALAAAQQVSVEGVFSQERSDCTTPSCDQNPPFYSINPKLYLYHSRCCGYGSDRAAQSKCHASFASPGGVVETVAVSLSGRGPAKSRQIRVVHLASAGSPMWLCGASLIARIEIPDIFNHLRNTYTPRHSF